MQIKNVEIFGLESSIIRSGYQHHVGEPRTLIHKRSELRKNGTNPIFNDNDSLRASKLANTPIGSGHNNYLKGIIVQLDIKYSQYFALQLQRYNFVDIISSQSKMHKITSINDIESHCNTYVIQDTCNIINDLIGIYNDFYNEHNVNYITQKYSLDFENKEELFQYIISNLPMGYEMWMGVSTNYLQLKTIYHQRRHHKLKDDWGYFCDWIETLPMSNLITGKE